jgi:hypothetical protein
MNLATQMVVLRGTDRKEPSFTLLWREVRSRRRPAGRHIKAGYDAVEMELMPNPNSSRAEQKLPPSQAVR